MIEIELSIRGVAAGFIIAAPVGPVNVVCIQRTIEKGWRAGVVSGLGAAIADTFYGAIAGFSITLVIQFLLKEEFWIRLIGGLLLIVIGAVYYFKPPASLKKKGKSSTHSDLVSTFILTLTNPTTVLSFLAVLATLGMAGQHASWRTMLLVAGIFCGSMVWWIVLSTIIYRLRKKITDKTMLWMNRIAGFAIAGFGLVNILLSHGHRH